VSTDLRARLQSTLGDAYTLERELGGGGMSRVFVANETAFGRKVVVKVLPPELAAGVSVDRFKREIQVAARLQHPHIVPVLSAGETDGLPFYTMPLVEGWSLRVRLAQGSLPLTEAISILREVARALAYAHARGVVHRDIKPDNVLLTAGTAVVTDFGIAKALSASRTLGEQSPTLTALGTSLGTPAYMAPEQAAGDPDTDHRADIYAFGSMAYEVLAGRPPFHGLSPHKLMAAHMGERPVPLGEVAPEVPAELAALVMRCLEKNPESRPQDAREIAGVLSGIVSSGSGHGAMPVALMGGRGMIWRALALYAAAFIAVAVVAKAAIVGIGLPDWVFPGALIVMALGLPVIILTELIQRSARRVFTSTPALTPGGSQSGHGTFATMAVKAAPHVSWHRTATGGALAIGTFVLLIGGYMVLRALGIGPAGSLMSAGKMSDRERVIIAEFRGPATDSLLGPTVTEAFRTDVSQSANLSVMPGNAVREVLQLMQRPAGTRVDYGIAREIAAREGMKAVIDGAIVELGGSYVLSARLIATQTGAELASFRETAEDERDIIPAISRLSRKLRSRLGESLRTVQSAQSLERVTTPSLQALQKYISAVRAAEEDGDWPRGRALLEEAIALDTGFAMAYRKLAIEYSNRLYPHEFSSAAIRKAYQHRDRLSESERLLTIAAYYDYGPEPDRARTISAYESLLEIDPEHTAALNNLSVQYRYRREYAKAEALAKRALAIRPSAVFYNNVLWSLAAQGKYEEAAQTREDFARTLPRNPNAAFARAGSYMSVHHYDSAAAVLDSVRRARQNEPPIVSGTGFWLGIQATAQGKLTEALRWFRISSEASAAIGNQDARLHGRLADAEGHAWFRRDGPAAVEIVDLALKEIPLDSIPPAARPYERIVWIYSIAGAPEKARGILAAFERRHAQTPLLNDRSDRHGMVAHIAMAEGRYDDALLAYRAGDEGPCASCVLPHIGRAYDLRGSSDSAIAVFERFIQTPTDPQGRVLANAQSLAGIHKRLGELYEARGERDKALSHYTSFIDLWKDADADLQPLVREARARVTELQRGASR
jgi:eukaryotic-like serine/threonine-protein kinase